MRGEGTHHSPGESSSNNLGRVLSAGLLLESQNEFFFQLVLQSTGVFVNLFEKLKGVTEIKLIFSSHVSVRTLYKLEWQVFILA